MLVGHDSSGIVTDHLPVHGVPDLQINLNWDILHDIVHVHCTCTRICDVMFPGRQDLGREPNAV